MYKVNRDLEVSSVNFNNKLKDKQPLPLDRDPDQHPFLKTPDYKNIYYPGINIYPK